MQKRRAIGKLDSFGQTIRLGIFAGTSTRELTNTLAVIFSYPRRAGGLSSQKKLILSYVESLFTVAFRCSSK